MASPLLIETERDSYGAGDTVRGTVMAVEALEKCQDLTVQLLYAGKRLGDQNVQRSSLAMGPVAAGQSFPFAFEIPLTAPFTFEGHAHDVVWKVKAVADLPWAIDPKAEQVITVAPKVVPNDPEAIAAVTEVPAAPVGKPVPTWVAILLLVLFAIPILAFVVLLLPFILYWIAKAKLINTRLRDFTLDIPERPMLLGEWVPVSVRFRLKKAIKLDRIKLLLRGTEQWSTGSGKSRRTHHHHFYEQELSELPATILAVEPQAHGSEVVVRAAVQLPADGLPKVLESSVYYQVKATAEIVGWPDPSAEKKIPVLAARLDEVGSAPPGSPVDQTSDGVVVLAEGQRPPLGVDISTAMGAIWVWLLMPVVGLGLGVAGIFVDLLVAGVPVLLVAGAAMLVLGLLGLFLKIFR